MVTSGDHCAFCARSSLSPCPTCCHCFSRSLCSSSFFRCSCLLVLPCCGFLFFFRLPLLDFSFLFGVARWLWSHIIISLCIVILLLLVVFVLIGLILVIICSVWIRIRQLARNGIDRESRKKQTGWNVVVNASLALSSVLSRFPLSFRFLCSQGSAPSSLQQQPATTAPVTTSASSTTGIVNPLGWYCSSLRMHSHSLLTGHHNLSLAFCLPTLFSLIVDMPRLFMGFFVLSSLPTCFLFLFSLFSSLPSPLLSYLFLFLCVLSFFWLDTGGRAVGWFLSTWPAQLEELIAAFSAQAKEVKQWDEALFHNQQKVTRA